MNHGPVRGVIFDLDDTLFDCTGLLTMPARERASAVLAPHTDLTATRLTSDQTELAATMGSTDTIRTIAARHDIPQEVVNDALAAYNRDDVPDIPLFDDAQSTITQLRNQDILTAIVTTGRRNRQLAKIDRLGLASHFVEGTSLFIHEEDAGPDKQPQLEQALAAGRLDPSDTLSVGDKLDSDIAVGNRIGLITVRYRHGRQKDAEPADASEQPAYDITRLSEILSIVKPAT